MIKFIVVFHYWFMDSTHFTVKTYECKDEDEAYAEACVHKTNTESQFTKCAFNMVEIETTEQVVNRKLTLWERISGKLHVNR